ncbi:MAG: hypothetical protein SWI22_02120 [Pseudomonadota bacterium]|nr:hypothetical protein [Pseudomonadota bacterium]
MKEETMSDEPGLPDGDEAKADLLFRLVKALDVSSADGRAGVGCLLRELEAVSPGAVERMAAGLQLRKIGWTGRTIQ